MDRHPSQTKVLAAIDKVRDAINGLPADAYVFIGTITIHMTREQFVAKFRGFDVRENRYGLFVDWDGVLYASVCDDESKTKIVKL